MHIRAAARRQLLGAVGADSKSRAFYRRVKGELEEALVALNFERLSLFQPSMILTPTNRYGIQQALALAFWPGLSRLLIGPTRKYRGIRIEALGAAMANNLATAGRAWRPCIGISLRRLLKRRAVSNFQRDVPVRIAVSGKPLLVNSSILKRPLHGVFMLIYA